MPESGAPEAAPPQELTDPAVAMYVTLATPSDATRSFRERAGLVMRQMLPLIFLRWRLPMVRRTARVALRFATARAFVADEMTGFFRSLRPKSRSCTLSSPKYDAAK